MTKFHQIRPWVVAVTKSSLHYTSFIVSSWFGTIPGEKNGYWGGHFWEFTSIDTVWVCVSAISTADMYSNSSDPHQRCHGSTKPFLLRRFNLVGLGKSCKVWLLWQKPMFKVSQCPLNHYRYWYIYIYMLFSKKNCLQFSLKSLSSIFSLHTTRSKHLPSIRCSPALRHRCGTHRGCRVQGIQRGGYRLWPDWIWQDL